MTQRAGPPESGHRKMENASSAARGTGIFVVILRPDSIFRLRTVFLFSGQYFHFPDSISAVPDSKSIFPEKSNQLIDLSPRVKSNSGRFSQREKLHGFKEALAAAKAFSY